MKITDLTKIDKVVMTMDGAKGDFALVMPDEIHQYKNTADDRPLVMICLVPKDYE